MSDRMEKCLEYGRQCLKQIRERGLYDPLVPRAVPAQAVSEFLASKQMDRGYLVIVAEPNIGKTGFMLNLSSNAAISYFFQDRSWCANILNFLNYLAAELHRRLTKDTPLPRYFKDPDDARMRVNSLLEKVGRSLGKDEKLLIVVDALDEVDLGDTRKAYLLKFDLPRGVYFVCASKRDPRILNHLKTYSDVFVSPWAKDNATIAELTDYIERCLPPTCTALEKQNLQILAGGNFQLAWFLLKDWKEGYLSLKKLPAELLTMPVYYKDRWKESLLQKARDPDLCEDVATLLAAARRPLSASVITSAIRRQRDDKIKVRNVEESLEDIATFLKQEQREEIKRWRPYDASFTRWLEEFYAGDLGQAHHALALALVDVLKSDSSPDFEYAAQYGCWHLRQWAKNTVDSSQKEQVQKLLKELIDDNKIREQVEQQAGADEYLARFLHEAVRYSEESGSLPNLVRFGFRYVNYHQKTKMLLDRLEELFKNDCFPEIMKITESLPEESENLGYLALIGCWAADSGHRDFLVEILDRILEKYEEGFGPFASIAATLIVRLIRLQEKDLLERFLWTISDDDFRAFITDCSYQIRLSLDNFTLTPDLAILFFRRIFHSKVFFSYQEFTFSAHIRTVAEMSLSTSNNSDQTAHQFIEFLYSLQDTEAKLAASRLLADVFSEHGLYQRACEAAEIVLEVAIRDPSLFMANIGPVITVLRRLPAKMGTTRLIKRLLQVIHAYDRTFDSRRTGALVTVLRYLADYQAPRSFTAVQGVVRSSIESLEHPLFQDYVRVQLAYATYKQKLYTDAVQEIELINDPRCRLWASVMIVGQALVSGDKIPLNIKKTMSGVNETALPSTQLLYGIIRKITKLATKPVFAPATIGNEKSKTNYPWFCVLAIEDAASFLNKVNSLTQQDFKVLGELLQDGFHFAVSISLERYWCTYDAMSVLLSQAKQITQHQIRQQVLSDMLSNIDQLRDDLLRRFLKDFAAALTTDDKELLDRFVEALPQLASNNCGYTDNLKDILLIIQPKFDRVKLSKTVECMLVNIAESSKYYCASLLIKVIPELLGPSVGMRLLEKLNKSLAKSKYGDWWIEQTYRAMAFLYVEQGLWGKVKCCREHLDDRDNRSLLLRSAYILDVKGQHREGRKFFAEALNISDEDEIDWTWLDVGTSIAIAKGFARSGDLCSALKTLRNIRNSIDIGSDIAQTLSDICRDYEPAEKGSPKLNNELLLIDSVLAKLTEQDEQIEGLVARAHFLKKAGLEEQVESIIQEVLDTITSQFRKLGPADIMQLSITTRYFHELVIDSGNEQWLQMWFKVTIEQDIIHSYTLEKLAEAAAVSTKINAELVVSKLINMLRHEQNKPIAGLLFHLSSLLRSINDGKAAVEYWNQVIDILSQVALDDFGYGANLPVHMFTCLAESEVGAEKEILLDKLVSAIWNVMMQSSSADSVRKAMYMYDIVHTRTAHPDFEDKKSALKIILTAIPFSAEDPCISAIVAKVLASSGQRDEAASLFKTAIDLSDKMQARAICDMKKSEIALIMAKSGFTAEVRPILDSLRETSSSQADNTKKNVILAFLQCNEPDVAASIADDLVHEEAKINVTAEFFCYWLRNYVQLTSVVDNTHTIGNNAKTSKAKDIALQEMEKYLTVIKKCRDTVTLNKCQVLQTIPSEIASLPLDDAIQWLSKLPNPSSYSDLSNCWKDLCSRYNYDQGVVLRILDAIPYQGSKMKLIEDLSRLDGEIIPNNLRLYLGAAAVHDQECFFDTICSALRNCTDPGILEEVKREFDEIAGISAVKSAAEAIPFPPEQTPIPQRETQLIEVEFTLTGVKVNRGTEKQFIDEWRMLEYFLWKNDCVHWTEGYLIFPGWRSLPDGATDGRKQFREKTTKCKQEVEKDRLKIEFTKTKDEKTVWWELVTYNISTKITKAESHYKKAEELFDNDKWGNARKMLLKALKAYPNHLQSHLLLVRCYEKQGPKKLSDAQLRELQSSWYYLDDKCAALNDIRRICSKRKEDKELQVFLSSLLNHPLYSQLEDLTEVLYGWIIKGELTEDEILTVEINKLLREIRTAKDDTVREEKTEAFCRIPCVAKILTSDTKLAEVSGLLFFSSVEDDLVTPRFQAIVRRTYKSREELQKFLRNTLVHLRKDLERQGRLPRLGGSKKIDDDIGKLNGIEQRLRQELQKERITNEELIKAAEAKYRWSRKYIKRLLEIKATKHYVGLRDDDSIKQKF